MGLHSGKCTIYDLCDSCKAKTYDLDGTTGLNDLPLSSELLSDEEVAEELNKEEHENKDML